MQALCAQALRELGFTVREERFEYSGWPGRWATPVAGWLSAVAMGAAIALVAGERPREALTLIGGALLFLAGAGFAVARHGVLDLPWTRASGINLVALRGGDGTDEARRAPVLLVAHTDTKSQPIPSAMRAAGVALTALGWLGTLLAAVMATNGGEVRAWWGGVAAAGILGSLTLAASTVGGRSPGALDNGSGVVTVLHAAAALPRELPAEVVIMSAEELGLAGARAHVRARIARGERPGTVLNVDGVDDHGTLVAMWSGRRPGRLLDTFDEAGRREGSPVAGRRLVPGILTDAVAFADAGWAAVTLSRGTWASLARVHRPGDDLSHYRSGEGMAEAARVLAATAGLLRSRPLDG